MPSTVKSLSNDCFGSQEQFVLTVKALGNDCFCSQELCAFIELSLPRGTAAVRMQRLVINGVVLTSKMSSYRVSL